MPTTTQIQLKKGALMTVSKNTVSSDAMQAEWLEIQAAQRSPAKFQPLYSRYYDQIYRFIFRRTGEEMLTGDLCAQVFMKAMQKLKSYKFKGVPFSAWLYRIASNEIAQHFRNIQKNRIVSIQDTNINELEEEVEIESLFEHRELLIETLNNLKDGDMQLIEMRFFENRPFKEIAEILDITESNAKVKTYRLLNKMKKLMLKRMV